MVLEFLTSNLWIFRGFSTWGPSGRASGNLRDQSIFHFFCISRSWCLLWLGDDFLLVFRESHSSVGKGKNDKSSQESKFFISAQAEISRSRRSNSSCFSEGRSGYGSRSTRIRLSFCRQGAVSILFTWWRNSLSDHICYRNNRTRTLKRHRFLSRGRSFFSKIFLGGRYFFKILSISCHIPIFQFPTVI